MTCASSSALVCEAYGSPPRTAPTANSAAPLPRRLGLVDKLADHCDVIAAPRAAHQWILQVFHDQVRPIEGAVDAARCRDALARIMRADFGLCAVAVPRRHGDDFAGWVVASPEGAAYVYVRHCFRRQHIGTALLRYVRAAGPIGLAYWTTDAADGAAHGLPVEHSLAAYAALLSLKRKGIE